MLTLPVGHQTHWLPLAQSSCDGHASRPGMRKAGDSVAALSFSLKIQFGMIVFRKFPKGVVL
jgi:hypothetical protein